LLIAKLQIIQKTVKGINIMKELENVKEWNYEQFVSYYQNQGASPVVDF